MGTLIYCDTPGCKNTDHSCDETIYVISSKAQTIIFKYLHDRPEHLCEYCFREIEEEMGFPFKVDEFLDLVEVKESEDE